MTHLVRRWNSWNSLTVTDNACLWLMTVFSAFLGFAGIFLFWLKNDHNICCRDIISLRSHLSSSLENMLGDLLPFICRLLMNLFDNSPINNIILIRNLVIFLKVLTWLVLVVETHVKTFGNIAQLWESVRVVLVLGRPCVDGPTVVDVTLLQYERGVLDWWEVLGVRSVLLQLRRIEMASKRQVAPNSVLLWPLLHWRGELAGGMAWSWLLLIHHSLCINAVLIDALKHSASNIHSILELVILLRCDGICIQKLPFVLFYESFGEVMSVCRCWGSMRCLLLLKVHHDIFLTFSQLHCLWSGSKGDLLGAFLPRALGGETWRLVDLLNQPILGWDDSIGLHGSPIVMTHCVL